MSSAKIVITGAAGLLGWQMRCLLKARGFTAVHALDRAGFTDAATLESAVAGAQAVFHFAGMNRGPDDVVASENVSITERLIEACRRSDSHAHVLFSSSTHIERDTKYGASKRRCAEMLQSWAAAAGARFTNVVIPNVFGEGGKPFYNSVVATFCHQLAQGDLCRVIDDARLHLIHALDVCEQMLAFFEGRQAGTLRLVGQPILVSEVLQRLTALHDTYRGGIVPALPDRFTLALFNTLRSYRFPRHYPVSPKLNTDPRGSLFEAVKSLNGGQTFISTSHPGVLRGNHYHLRKVERFLLIRGAATIHVRRLFDDAVHAFKVTGDAPACVDMPTMHTHDIVADAGTEIMTLFWANEIFDPQNPDTFPEPVVAAAR
jgi:UDP-2-acetamido-2,6-beta-L-arabino-hexul-4-ose reductase